MIGKGKRIAGLAAVAVRSPGNGRAAAVVRPPAHPPGSYGG